MKEDWLKDIMETQQDELAKEVFAKPDIWFVVACLAPIFGVASSMMLYVGSDRSAVELGAIGLVISIGRILKGHMRPGYWVMVVINMALYVPMALHRVGL